MVDAAFLFPGQGSQYVGMGKDLYQTYPAAKEVYDQASKILDFDIIGTCFEGPSERLTQTRYSQPAIFVTSIAALAVLKQHAKMKELNVRFAAGLSLGEATALCAAAARSFEDGLKFVRSRGQFMDAAAAEHPGMMAAVLGTELPLVEKICDLTGAEVGNLNAPGQIVISGFRKNVEDAIEKLREAGAKKVIPLDVSGGFHSKCMDSACKKIEAALENIQIVSPKIAVVSNLTAKTESDPAQIKRNLVLQMNHRTLWEDSMRYIISQGVRTFVELAPGKVLKGLLKKIDPAAETQTVGTLEDFHVIDSQTIAG